MAKWTIRYQPNDGNWREHLRVLDETGTERYAICTSVNPTGSIIVWEVDPETRNGIDETDKWFSTFIQALAWFDGDVDTSDAKGDCLTL